jgi:hypothetical protein
MKVVYFVESIGAQFKDKDLPRLAGLLNSRADEGFIFHSVFHVSQPGCLGIGSPTTTYLAIYKKEMPE